MRKRTFIVLFFAMAMFSVLTVSCEKKDSDSKAAIFFSATTNPTATKVTYNDVDINVKSFKINIAEIEFELNKKDPLYKENKPVYNDDIELKGPFTIDLLLNGQAQINKILDGVDIPVASYEEIEFEFDKVTKSGHSMYQKSIIIEGTINKIPFEYYTDEEFEMEVEFPGGLTIDGTKKPLINVEFDIAKLFNPTLGGVDISGAVDTNKDGKITITNMDCPDKNNEIASHIKNCLKSIIKSFEKDN